MHVVKVIMDRVLSELEVVLSIFMIILVVVMTVRLFGTTFFSADPISKTSGEYIEYVLNLAIGIEFAKMLFHHTPETIIEVLMFAISRHMIAEHPTPLETLLGVASIAALFLGVASIAALFAIKKFLITDFRSRGYVICGGHTTVRRLKLLHGISLPIDGSRKLGDVVRENLEQKGLPVEPGAAVTIGNAEFLIEKMQDEDIKKIEIIYSEGES